jgi:hypothetical protein
MNESTEVMAGLPIFATSWAPSETNNFCCKKWVALKTPILFDFLQGSSF